MMRRYILLPQAQRQVREIRSYGEEAFGSTQAKRYQDDLKKQFSKLAENPQMGPSFEGGTRLWPWPGGQHLIMYEPTETGIDVLAVERKGCDLERVAGYLRQQQKDILARYGRPGRQERGPGKDFEPE